MSLCMCKAHVKQVLEMVFPNPDRSTKFHLSNTLWVFDSMIGAVHNISDILHRLVPILCWPNIVFVLI